ncbi:hypothetical protein SH661x_003982 [Planctomicrobium sp. SH661]|uniref:hypothetical protein n=1 Tax=Planctomicrobium sp. SH661 TaxID=3448124 RepID=UPI003F5C1A3A
MNARKIRPAQVESVNRQGGAVIIVVVSLLTTLLFLGLFFYNWTSQEVANAQYFSNSQLGFATRLNPEPLFDAAAEQLIVGTSSSYPYSALRGGVHSMLAHQIGRIDENLAPTDTNPGSGNGIVVRFTDADNNGYPDINPSTGGFNLPDDYQFIYHNGDRNNPQSTTLNINTFRFNHGPLAQDNANFDAFNQPTLPLPYYQPDVDYTYPDHNSLFLGYETTTIDPTDSSNRAIHVLIPSFFRPQLFPSLRSNDDSGDFSSLYSNVATKAQVFRPHQFHRYQSGEERYLTTAGTPANSGDRSRVLGAFPFPAAGVNAKMGVFSDITSGAASKNYTFLDTDLDNDGIKDSIYIDLDLPLQTINGDQEYMPMASIKVIDADALINPNVHGNLQGYGRLSRTPNGNEPVSTSNLGMSRSEVNPLPALSADLSVLSTAEQTAALANSTDKFGVSAANTMQLANMEWLMMLTGWDPTSGESETLGRYGDRDRLTAMQLPLAGQPLTDDDGDNASVGGFGQVRTADPDLLNLPVPGFVHPLSPIGMGMRGYSSDTGSYLVNSSGNLGARRIPGFPVASNPAMWPQYFNFQQLTASDYPSSLMQTTLTAIQQDEDDETIIEPGSSLYGQYDEPFSTSDSAFLQLSDGDQYRAGVSSRLATLAAANFQHAPNAAEIRRRFTTDSWDRLEYGYAAPLDRLSERGLVANDQFPPIFNATSGVQPFRKEIRDLFHAKFGEVDTFGSNRTHPRHRLNINQILSDDQTGGGGAPAIVNGNPRYRNLVPHPDTLSGAGSLSPMYHGEGTPPVAFSDIASNVFAQEWWARYDRQRLARDIYCLLWTLGCGTNSDITVGNPYTPQQTREMAQFAVNVVDAIDRDSVITAFEYDEDLSDGWSLTPPAGNVVYGIELQEVAFNEVLFIRSQGNKSDDSDKTEFDDKGPDVYFSYVELRNAAPWQVDLGNGSWRIRRITRDAAGSQIFSATLKSTDPSMRLDVGEEFLIGTHCGRNKEEMAAGYRPSNFRFDDGSGQLKLICPNYEEATLDLNKDYCDLDLMFSYPSGTRTEEGVYTTTTSLLNDSNGTGVNEVRLVLERRLRPDPSKSLTDALNPWVEVDRIEGNIREFNPEYDPGNPTEAASSGLPALKSQERREPFDSGITFASLTPQDYAGTADPSDGLHTLPYLNRAAPGSGQRRNERAPAQFTIWQPHFDRDLSSVMELLSIPLYGNYGPGISGTWNRAAFGGAVYNVAEPGTTLAMTGHRTAAMRLLYPQDSTGEVALPTWFPSDSDVPGAEHYRNRWYRALEFLHVKSQDELRTDAITAVQRRTPGKLNLNTIRDESVFAGLVDDPYHIDFRNASTMTQDLLEGANRRWFVEHRRFRDGVDPFLAGSIPNVTIPGGVNARPFRPLSYLDQPTPEAGDYSIQSTILRQRDPNGDGSLTEGHGLYEARHSAIAALDAVDYHTRQRILSKISNNSTTRSHVFFVWLGIDFFEAHVNNNNNVQIGAKADPEVLPGYRMFCVVDMSRLEEAYNPLTGTFDFRKFIIHRQLLP